MQSVGHSLSSWSANVVVLGGKQKKKSGKGLFLLFPSARRRRLGVECVIFPLNVLGKKCGWDTSMKFGTRVQTTTYANLGWVVLESFRSVLSNFATG